MTRDFSDDDSRPLSPPEDIPSLLDRQGHFHPDRREFFAHASAGDAYREARAQVERAVADGIDITHMDSHEGTLQLRPEFAEIYVRLATEFRLPIRAGSRALLADMGIVDDWVGLIRKQGIHVPDNLIYIPINRFGSYREKEEYTSEVLSSVPTGITEIYFHPTLPESKLDDQRTESYRQMRQWDFQYLVSDRLRHVLSDMKITLIDFRGLRDLTRKV